MGLQIEDGIGDAYRAQVNNENQLSTVAVVHELQHHISSTYGRVFQVIGDHTLVSAGTKTILHLTNDDPARNVVISYMRVQYPDSTSLIDASTYFQLGLGTTYGSGGSAVSPVNMSTASGNVATVSSFDDDPIVTGTFTEIDRWYCDNEMMIFNKHGSLILGLGGSLEWRLTTDQDFGLVYARITLMMIARN